mmetsp:Transcript_24891/g.80373  ORF Transcript_24891/g.80373 Transcript_24891/m.80373 type:complete len:276 (-) Transcript_24891:679-1506(-)
MMGSAGRWKSARHGLPAVGSSSALTAAHASVRPLGSTRRTESRAVAQSTKMSPPCGRDLDALPPPCLRAAGGAEEEPAEARGTMAGGAYELSVPLRRRSFNGRDRSPSSRGAASPRPGYGRLTSFCGANSSYARVASPLSAAVARKAVSPCRDTSLEDARRLPTFRAGISSCVSRETRSSRSCVIFFTPPRAWRTRDIEPWSGNLHAGQISGTFPPERTRGWSSETKYVHWHRGHAERNMIPLGVSCGGQARYATAVASRARFGGAASAWLSLLS